MAMAVEPRITWQTVTIEDVKKMELWQLKELSEARKRDRKIAAEQAAENAAAGLLSAENNVNDTTASGLPSGQNTLVNGTAAPSTSQQPKAPDATQTGPVRSTRRTPRVGPYQDSKKDSNGEKQPEPNGVSVPVHAHPTATFSAHEPEPAEHLELASKESIKEVQTMMVRLKKELEELEKENHVVMANAADARAVAARLKAALDSEREKTAKVVDSLKNWLKDHPGWKFDDVFSKERATATAVDLDPEQLARLEKDFEDVDKADFEALKRVFGPAVTSKKEIPTFNNESEAADDDIEGRDESKGKGKGKAQDKGKGKERAVDVDETRLPTIGSKDKGKAKEVASGSPSNKRKRTWSELQSDVAMFQFMKHQVEAAQLAEAKRRSRLDMSSTNPQASGSGSRLPEASGNITRLPEASGNASKLREEAIAADEEPQLKRRKVHWNRAGTSPDSETAPQTFEEQAKSFSERLLRPSLWPGIPRSLSEHTQPKKRRYLGIIRRNLAFDDANKEPKFDWNSDGTPNIKLPEPTSPNYVSEIQRACRFLWTPPPKEIVRAPDIFKLNNETIPLPAHGPYFDWSVKGVPVIQLPEASHPSFLPILLRVGQELGDYDPSLEPSRRRVRATAESSLHCSWDFARRPVVILPPPEDPKYAQSVHEAAKFILRGPGPENVWRPSAMGFFKVLGKALRGDVPIVKVVRNTSVDGGFIVQLPNHTAQNYNESILLANEKIEDILTQEAAEEEAAEE